MFDLEEMVKEITESEEYTKYKEIGNILESDSYVMALMDEIKELQQEAVILEYNEDPRYLELDEIIKEKVALLNDNATYKLYLEKMEEYNKFIANSNNLFESFVGGI